MGLKTDEWRRWDFEQNLISNVNWEKGLKDGISKLYRSNGKLQKEQIYENGKLNGKYTIYYADGIIAERGKMKNDKKEGIVYTYYRTGAVESKINYRNGLIHGKSIFYNSDGEITVSRKYKNGEVAGDLVSNEHKKKIGIKSIFKANPKKEND